MHPVRIFAIRLLAGVTLAVTLTAAAPPPDAPMVRLDNGQVKGVRSGAVVAFLGVPYAQPPVDGLRWRDPQPVRHWNGIRNATQKSAACYQSPSRLFGPYTDEFLNQAPVSEDCLYLNVWTPGADTKGRPVLVYIHGGGFGSGSASMPIYDGAKLAGRGVVVISINYRLGVFGFMAHPELTRESGHGTSGNYGLLDMIAALKWVRSNVARLGGNPDDVTISGESAGAAAVNDLIVAPAAKGLFQRAVAVSGSGMGVNMRTLEKAEGYGVELAQRVGAGSIADLRKLSPAQLQEASYVPPPKSGKNASMPEIRFAPNDDGVVVKGDPGAGSTPIVSNVPLMTGFNADEGTVFGVPKSPADFEEFVKNRYGDFADRFLALYPHSTTSEIDHSIKEISRDRYMANLLVWARERVRSSGQAVYPYLYDHPYPAATGGAAFGAFHTASVPYLFGNLGMGPRKFTDKDVTVSRQLQDYLIAFMQHGSPATPSSPWARFSPDDSLVMGLGDTLGPRPALSSPQRETTFQAYLEAGGKLSLF